MENYFMKNIKYVREKRGLSQSKLAEMIDVNHFTARVVLFKSNE